MLYDTSSVLFLSTLSLRRATLIIMLYDTSSVLFLSTLSLRRATISCAWSASKLGDFYPRSPCGERRWLRCWQLAAQDISIHALLAESDLRVVDGSKSSIISIHALLAESDCLWVLTGGLNYDYFYPRSPCGERRISNIINNVINDFYPRSPCGERRRCFNALLNRFGFLSTLSLRRATQNPGKHYVAFRFLSTLSLRRATGQGCRLGACIRISIHALLAESDLRQL